MNKRIISYVTALTLLATLVMPAPSVSAAYGCKSNETARVGVSTKVKNWYKPSNPQPATKKYAGIKFVSKVYYTSCTTISSSRVIIKSSTISWSPIHRSLKPTWSCAVAGGVRSVTMNPDSIAGHDYGAKTWSCASGSGSITYNFIDKAYGYGYQNERCLGVKVKVDLSYGLDHNVAIPQNCV